MNKPCPHVECCCPGDRDDNLWITINEYKPPKTQEEWESTCFLDKCFHGYYKWPRLIKYPMNRRERYQIGTMPDNVAIIYHRFMDKEFLSRFLKFIVVDQEGDEHMFDFHRFRIFKVRNPMSIMK